MPRVSEEHLARRRRQILDAALDCFVEQGFHVTSMQDIFRASGLSAGAVYRYFPSKTALIREIATDTLAEAARALDDVGPDHVPPVADVISSIVRNLGRGRPSRVPIIIQVWAEALRDEELADLARSLFGRLLDGLQRLLDRQAEAGQLPPGTDRAALARLLLAMIQGYIVQFGIFGDVPDDDVESATRAFFGG